MPESVAYGTTEYHALVRISASERLNPYYYDLQDRVTCDHNFAVKVANPVTTEDEILSYVEEL